MRFPSVLCRTPKLPHLCPDVHQAVQDIHVALSDVAANLRGQGSAMGAPFRTFRTFRTCCQTKQARTLQSIYVVLNGAATSLQGQKCTQTGESLRRRTLCTHCTQGGHRLLHALPCLVHKRPNTRARQLEKTCASARKAGWAGQKPMHAQPEGTAEAAHAKAGTCCCLGAHVLSGSPRS